MSPMRDTLSDVANLLPRNWKFSINVFGKHETDSLELGARISDDQSRR